MGEGLKRVAKQCGGLIAKTKGRTVRFDADGKPSCTEKEFTAQVIELAKLRGWLVAHFRPAETKRGWRTAVQGDGAGFPDLVLVRDLVIFAELKTDVGKLSPAQEDWGQMLVNAAEEYYIWRPRDWDRIVQILK